MSRRLLSPMPERITAPQGVAADPQHSVWVTANAGSGKTYVLTNRVLRLLLAGVAPAEILCLTYTKAAAAEMRGRVSQRLSEWALATDTELRAALERLEGRPPAAATMLRARSLFAHALETPGGLKIQTIHAFCEAVLHRFPKEAGVPFDFSVIEDFERDAMLQEARETVLAAGLRGDRALADAVETLFGLLSDFVIETAIREALSRQPLLRKILADVPRARRELRRVADNPPEIDAVLAAIAGNYGLSAADHAAVFRLVPPDPAGDDFVDRLARIDPDAPDPDALYAAFLTQTFTARKTLLKKATAQLIPDIAARLTAEAQRLELLHADRVRAELVARSDALLTIIAAIVAHYETAKRARSLLDFDDLIERLGALLDDEVHGPWVRYKLDAQLSHILVDEGQDTNPEQWNVIRALIEEYFHGESAADRPRTLFVVGDQKQSIFSFQGADPNEFVATGRKVWFSARSVQLELKSVPLRHSFRTLPALLRAVDIVFDPQPMRDAILEDVPVHETARAEAGGTVTLWPPIKEVEEEDETDAWPTQAPVAQTQSAPRRVAERIARQIRGWLDSGRTLGPRDRAVRADDILILVQVRSVLFHEVIRALVREAIPTPGADRLAVTTHIGTLDLIALGDVLSNSADDLQLAALLRSPLFDVSEDDLFALAQPRGERQTLWSAMAASPIPSVQAAFAQLSGWRNRLDFDRPYSFYSDVLYGAGGLRRMRARFGSEIDDVVSEFLELALAHEQAPQPSLIGFLAELRARDITIKRELAEGGFGVRVMTVHGAKGLEAPIVILADAASTEEGRDRRAVFMQDNPPLLVHASSKAQHVDGTMDLRGDAERAQKAEYWRKLYVAMTRAEDELYVTGYLTKARDGTDSWYEAIRTALEPDSDVVTDAAGETIGLIYPRERAATRSATTTAPAAAPSAPPDLPNLPPYRLPRIVRPSRLAEDTGEALTALDTAAARVTDWRDPESARQEGIALHALLQHLSRVPAENRQILARKAIASLLKVNSARADAVVGRALSILANPALAPLFGPDSRGEVPILAHGRRGREPIMVAGRIDRLVVTPQKVLIVDFKSDAVAPTEAGRIPQAYVNQLGLYALVAGQLFKGREIAAAILWTELESLMNLPQAALFAAVESITLG